MKMKKGLCPCFGKKRRSGTADSPIYGDAAVDRWHTSRNGGGSSQWLQDHVLRGG